MKIVNGRIVTFMRATSLEYFTVYYRHYFVVFYHFINNTVSEESKDQIQSKKKLKD
jgi:hypothetical protein